MSQLEKNDFFVKTALVYLYLLIFNIIVTLSYPKKLSYKQLYALTDTRCGESIKIYFQLPSFIHLELLHD